MKLSTIRKNTVGGSDDYHYRSLSGRSIGMPISRRHKSVWLCSENTRFGYRGIVRIDRTDDGWETVEGSEQFEQNNPRSFTAMLRDAAELGF